eukprot:scaffold576_cov260-Pinguiococcus_pyrenoidosus.AAC.74
MRVLLVAQLPPFSLQPLHLRLVPAWAVGRGTLLACSRFVHGVLKSSEVPPAFFDGSPIFLDLLAIVCAEKATAPVVVRRDAVEVAASKDQPRVVAQADLGYGFRDVLGFASPGDDARVLYGILICEQHHAVHLGLIQQAVEGHVVVDDHAVGDARAAESGHVKICCLPARRSRERHHLEAPAHANVHRIQDLGQVASARGLLPVVAIADAEGALRLADAPLDDDSIPVDLSFESFPPRVSQSDAHDGLVVRTSATDEVGQLAPAVCAGRSGPEADLERVEEGGLARTVRARDEVHVRVEVYVATPVIHEVLELYLFDDTARVLERLCTSFAARLWS